MRMLFVRTLLAAAVAMVVYRRVFRRSADAADVAEARRELHTASSAMREAVDNLAEIVGRLESMDSGTTSSDAPAGQRRQVHTPTRNSSRLLGWFEQRPAGRLIAIGAGVILPIVLLVMPWVQPLWAPPLPIVRGRPGILVAQFSRPGAFGMSVPADEGDELGATIVDKINGEDRRSDEPSAEYGGYVVRDGWGIPDTFIGVERHAMRSTAAIVVYGTLRRDGRSIDLKYWISPERLIEAPELAGGYSEPFRLRTDEDIALSPLDLDNAADAVAERSLAFAELWRGTNLYLSRDYSEAATVLTRFLRNNGETDVGAVPMMLAYLHRGNVALLWDEEPPAAAIRYYDEGLRVIDGLPTASVDPSRLLFARAEALYHSAKGTDCRTDVDVSVLRKALEGYAKVKPRGELEADRFLEAKRASGIGRTHVCLALAGHRESVQLALNSFDSVTTMPVGSYARYATHKQLVAEAVGNRGLLHYWFGNDEQVCEAASELAEAARLSSQDERARLYRRYEASAMDACV